MLNGFSEIANRNNLPVSSVTVKMFFFLSESATFGANINAVFSLTVTVIFSDRPWSSKVKGKDKVRKPPRSLYGRSTCAEKVKVIFPFFPITTGFVYWDLKVNSIELFWLYI